MKKLKSVLVFLCILFILCGCRQTTVISRDDQVGLLPQSPTTEAEATHPAQPSDSPESTPSEKPTETEATDTTETTESQQSHSGSGSASTKPTTETSTGNSTKPTESTTGTPTETTGDTTSPDDTHEETEPSTDSTEETEAPTEPEKDPYDISGHTVGSLEYGIHAAINAERTAAGLPELSLDGSLCAIASVRAYECSLYWSHTRPNGSDWSTVLSAYGYGGYSCAAENLLQSSDGMDAAGAVAIWASSDSHREKMCNPAFTRLGVGVYTSDGMIYLACIFTD